MQMIVNVQMRRMSVKVITITIIIITTSIIIVTIRQAYTVLQFVLSIHLKIRINQKKGEREREENKARAAGFYDRVLLTILSAD